MSKHLFPFKWQAMQHEELRNTIQEADVGAVMGFGQNINHTKQHEAQSSHYNGRQSTIFPIVCFLWCTLCSELVMQEICCLSDDLKHDAFAVRAFQLEAVKILQANGMKVNKMFEWSDNCSLEFKSKLLFHVLSRIPLLISRYYWGKNHGKGPANSVIGRFSQFIYSAIPRKKTSISHGMDMALYLQEHLGTPTYKPSNGKWEHYQWTLGIIWLPPGILGQYQSLALGLDSWVQASVLWAGGYLGAQTTQIGATSNLITFIDSLNIIHGSTHGYRSQVPLI